MSVTIGLVGDLHLSDKSPSKCHDSYNDDLFDLLTEIIDVFTFRQVDAVVFAGDSRSGRRLGISQGSTSV